MGEARSDRRRGLTSHSAELDAILEQVEAAGLVEQYTDADGKQAMCLRQDALMEACCRATLRTGRSSSPR